MEAPTTIPNRSDQQENLQKSERWKKKRKEKKRKEKKRKEKKRKEKKRKEEKEEKKKKKRKGRKRRKGSHFVSSDLGRKRKMGEKTSLSGFLFGNIDNKGRLEEGYFDSVPFLCPLSPCSPPLFLISASSFLVENRRPVTALWELNRLFYLQPIFSMRKN